MMTAEICDFLPFVVNDISKWSRQQNKKQVGEKVGLKGVMTAGEKKNL